MKLDRRFHRSPQMSPHLLLRLSVVLVGLELLGDNGRKLDFSLLYLLGDVDSKLDELSQDMLFAGKIARRVIEIKQNNMGREMLGS